MTETRFQNFCGSNIICNVYDSDSTSANMGNHVFISKKATHALADFIIKEKWGKNNILLYKYLDNIWRLQLMNKMVKLFRYRNQTRIIFHSGLLKRDTNEYIYLCCVPNHLYGNQKVFVTQKYKVALGLWFIFLIYSDTYIPSFFCYLMNKQVTLSVNLDHL